MQAVGGEVRRVFSPTLYHKQNPLITPVHLGPAPSVLESYPTIDPPPYRQFQSVSTSSAARVVAGLGKLTYTQSTPMLPSHSEVQGIPNQRVQRANNSLPSLIDMDTNESTNVAIGKRKKNDDGKPTPLWRHTGQVCYTYDRLLHS